MANTLFMMSKSDDEAAEDRANRVARVGGLWRQPNYLKSYAKAGTMLLHVAAADECYDDVGLPLFYLQRHTVELAIKDVIHTLLDIGEMEEILAAADAVWSAVADDCARRTRSNRGDDAYGHDLAALVVNAKRLLGAHSAAMQLPDEFERVVRIVVRVENDDHAKARPDRLRYSHLLPRKGEMRHDARSIPTHVERGGTVAEAPPLLLPLGELHNAIEALLGGPMRYASHEDDSFFADLAMEVGALDQKLYAAGRVG